MRGFIMTVLLMFLAGGADAFAQGNLVEVYKLPNETEHYVSQTHYNYSRVAEQLTRGCRTDLEKIEAIYDWITRNIAYDTTYTIHTADECFDQRKGVCQAYCELFYRIATAAGLRVEIISGISRDIYGRVRNSGHAWLFAYTRENHGILLDPTWDAGAVNGTEFIREKYHRSWFGVDPKWMILTHFPKDPSYQLLPEPMTEEDFRSLDYPFSLQYIYGFDVDQMYSRARAHTLSMPKVYSGCVGDFVLLEAPLESSLLMGRSYTFRIRVKCDKEFILIAGGRWYSTASGDWVDEGNGVYSIVFTPKSPGDVHLGMRVANSNSAATAVAYGVTPSDGEPGNGELEVVTLKTSIGEVLASMKE